MRRRELLPLTIGEFLASLVWLNGRPLLEVVEPYRRRLFEAAFQRAADVAFAYNLILAGRAKKNWKTADLVIACLFALLDDSPGGNQVYLVANDAGQAQDDLELAKKVITVNPLLADALVVRRSNVIERRDGAGFLEVLPGQDAIGAHGKTFRLLGVDEIHGYRNWDLLEALAMDPTRPDAQTWITSYASLFHKPGVPLFDLMAIGKAGSDPRMLFSWYGADYTTDPDFVDVAPDVRANPSMASWNTPDYVAQQQRRLPAHKFRRLHLNLPGLPEGSAFQPEPIMDAVARGIAVRPPERDVRYIAFVDMSGGSNDDCCLAIAHQDADGCVVLDCVVNQGPPPPFDPSRAVTRFVATLREYRVATVTGDKYAGNTFASIFQTAGIGYAISERTKSELYEALEPLLNGHRVTLLDVPVLEQQLLGLVWRGGKIDHPNGEHDDYANAGAAALVLAAEQSVDARTIDSHWAASLDESLDEDDDDDALVRRSYWLSGFDVDPRRR
jgi:hypothetical protein